METFRVLYRNGGWLDIQADGPVVADDGYVRLFVNADRDERGMAVGHDGVVALFPREIIAAVVLADRIEEGSLIPLDCEYAAATQPVDLSGPCWPDTEKV